MPKRQHGFPLTSRRISLADYAVIVSLLIFCVYSIWVVGRAGFAKAFAGDVESVPVLSAADQAVHLNPFDPEAHYARALSLSKLGRSIEALTEFENCVALRPRDSFLWLQLGYARENLNDFDGALASYREAVRLAPYYAQPRWYLGQLLLATHKREKLL